MFIACLSIQKVLILFQEMAYMFDAVLSMFVLGYETCLRTHHDSQMLVEQETLPLLLETGCSQPRDTHSLTSHLSAFHEPRKTNYIQISLYFSSEMDRKKILGAMSVNATDKALKS